MAEKDPHWIEHMHMRKGALHEKTHTPEGKDISAKRLHAAEKSKNGTERKRRTWPKNSHISDPRSKCPAQATLRATSY